eukprot:scaffold104094_cov28-Tisochrysis_lutea.AAC.1
MAQPPAVEVAACIKVGRLDATRTCRTQHRAEASLPPQKSEEETDGRSGFVEGGPIVELSSVCDETEHIGRDGECAPQMRA